MNATDPSLANILQTQGNLEHYHVPKYQREYTWGKTEWEQLLEDIEEFEDYKLRLSNIRKQLIHKKSTINKAETGYFKEKDKYCFLRVQPSTQKANYKDYLHLVAELGLIKGNFNSKFFGIRRISKGFSFFYDHLPESLEGLNELLHKINSLKFIHIAVSSSSDAFTLFESLNNRGVPLSVMDIIKNKMLANLEKQHKMNIDDAYDEWQSLLEFLPDYQEQERFLRHYYNSFKVYPDIKIEKYTRATKSNLIKIFEQFIKKNAKNLFDDLIEKAETYNYFIQPENYDDDSQTKSLIDLKRIDKFFNDRDKCLDEVLAFLVKYYIRRNITDFPNTRDLDAINIEVIENCQKSLDEGKKLNSKIIIDFLTKGKGKPADIEKLKDGLEDNLFYYNSGMVRYVLAKLDEVTHSREYKPDLWARNEKGLLVWTVEHIFPQGNNIPKHWIDMIADGDKNKAQEIQENWVHCLGNLTLSGYNSQLSNASFDTKQDLHQNKKFLGYKINIGYKNGLSLNNIEFEYKGKTTSLGKVKEWTEESIESRNDIMVDTLLRLFAFEEKELSEIKSSEK